MLRVHSCAYALDSCAYAFDEALRDVSSSSVSAHTGIYSIYMCVCVYMYIYMFIFIYMSLGHMQQICMHCVTCNAHTHAQMLYVHLATNIEALRHL